MVACVAPSVRGIEPADKTPTPADIRFFESKVRPLLIERCYSCHSLEANLAEGGLRLDTRDAMLRGGSSGPVLVPGEPESSMIVRAVDYQDPDLQMPPKDSGGKLTEGEIKILKQWIRSGAPDPRKEPAHLQPEDGRTQAVSDWWAYQPLMQTSVPTGSEWAWNDIDRWIEAKHSEMQIEPNRDADPNALIRRLTFDITGLPPTVEAVLQFETLLSIHSRKEAIEIVVDQLLESDDFGPHWGRHWLDVARYGESTGREVNVPYNQAWRYRDWVIDAMTENMPFDRFLMAQIAGDLLPTTNDAERAANLIATGFLAVGSRSINEQNPMQFAVDQADEQIDTLFQATMATTFACARCHDHKFDPITQSDYTAVAGILLSTDTRFGVSGGNNSRNGASGIELPPASGLAMPPLPWSDDQIAEKRQQIEEIRQRRTAMDEELKAQRKGATGGQGIDRNKQQELRKLTNQLIDLEFQLSCVGPDGEPKPVAMGVIDKPFVTRSEAQATGKSKNRNRANNSDRRPNFSSIGDSPFFARGDIGMPGARIPRSVPGFCGNASRFSIPPHVSGRLELAQWMVDLDNPLTPRVAVNRIWAWMMGRGIVESVDNFGTTGSKPGHPELLDQLSIEFQRSGWDMKQLIRKIATSRAYQLSSIESEDSECWVRAFSRDPENRTFWRGKRRRLQAEEIRDAMLEHSGRLNRERVLATTMAKHYSNKINLGIGRKRAKGELLPDDVCRSVYLPLPRSMAPEVLDLFDLPDGSFVQGMREATNVPSQSLYLLNSPQVAGHAASIAKWITQRIPGRGSDHFSERVHLLFEHLLARTPAEEELQWATALWKNSDGGDAGWVSIVRGLLATAEYRYLD
jgi:hypothetical protein